MISLKHCLCSIFLCAFVHLAVAEPVSHFQLKNGLQVFIKPDHRAPIAIVMVWYPVGSADEPGGLTGISHALEHMMFKGTPLIPAGQFSQIIAKQGGQDNAFTSQDYTVYFEKISTKTLKTALKLEADRMQHLNLSPDEFAKEIKVVREERRLRTDNNPQALAFERFMATAHLATPYQHPIVGWMSDLQRLSVQDVRAWYQRYYTPNHARLVIVGDVNAAEIKPWIQQAFQSITKQTQLTSHPQVEPIGLGIKRVDIHAPAQQPVLLMGYTVPNMTPTESSDAYALELLAGILDAGENARLSQSLIRTQHLASAASVYYDSYSRYQSQFTLFAMPSPPHSLTELKQALLKEIHLLKTTMISPEELRRVKTQLVAQKTFEQDSLFGQAMELGMLETLGLGHQTAERYARNIQAVTAGQLRQTAQRYFIENNLTEASLLPIKPQKDPA
ncbi:MAG: pitrilysin family protein [Gammaproteobacteria bacterium]|nr:pitrilysin family protein [Gammaproteobacteria bacterium]